MEEKFYLDEFELSLQEQANQFKMVPTKKVWHGIYNDLHPGRRWPSVMVSLVLIFSIVFVGYINSHSEKNSSQANTQVPVIDNGNNVPKPGMTNENNQLSTKPVNLKNDKYNGIEKTNSADRAATSFSQLNKRIADVDVSNNQNKINRIPANQVSGQIIKNRLTVVSVIKDENKDSWNKKNTTDEQEIIQENGIGINTVDIMAKQPDLNLNGEGVKVSMLPNYYKNLNFVNILQLVSLNQQNNKLTPPAGNYQVNSENSSETQNAVLAVTKKKNDKMNWVYYAGPSISTVSFSGVPLKENTNANLSSPLPQITQKDMKIIRNPAFGFEAGIQMNYLFAKKLQFTTGAHVTHSGYNIISNLVHPTLATLTLRNTSTGDSYSRNFVTHYGDGTGKSTVTLHNYSYQASIPVGFEYLMWDNKNFQLNLAANFEPSLIFQADAYLLSADGKNYVNVPDLMRKWNFSSNFSPFLSFRSSKLKWNIGPNIRYQWLSTYQKTYTVREHLIDYGIRIGISK